MKNKIISIYQITGGSLGFLFVLYNSLTMTLNSFQSIGIIFMLFLHCYVIFSGYSLLKSFKKGSTFTVIAQFLQLFSLQIPYFQFKFYTGTFLQFSLENGKFDFLFNILKFSTKIGFEKLEIWDFELNLIPILVIIILLTPPFGVECKRSC